MATSILNVVSAPMTPGATPASWRRRKPVLVGATLVVVVLSTVVGGYQLTRSGSEESASPATGPTPPRASAPGSAAVAPRTRPPLAFTLRPATVADVRLLPSYADATRQRAYFAAVDRGGLLDIEAELTLYEAGRYDPRDHNNDSKVTVNGRAGFFGLHDAIVAAGDPRPLPTLSWPYRDNAWAVLVSARSLGSARRLRQLARAVATGPAYQARVPCRLGYLPAGLRPVSVEGVPLPDAPHMGWFAVRFADKTAGEAGIAVLGGAALRLEWRAGPHGVVVHDVGPTTVGGRPAGWRAPNASLAGELEVDFPEGVGTLRVDPKHVATYPRSELERIMLGLRCAPALTEADQAGWYELSTALGR